MKKWILLLFFSACATTPSSSLNKVLTAQQDPASPFKFLNVSGQSSYSRFSPDGASLYYVSSTRSSHSQKQIYKLDLSSSAERRLNHSPGESLYPVPTDKGDLYFFSENRHLKNLDRAISKKLTPQESNSNPSLLQDPHISLDLYVLDRKTADIELIQYSEGFSGHGAWNHSLSSLFFISQFDGRYTVKRVQPSEKKISVETIYKSPGQKILLDLALSPKGEIYVVESDKALSSIEFVYLKHNQPQNLEFLPKGQFLSPVFLDETRGLISYRESSKKDFQIFQFNLNTKCFQNLLQSAGDHLFSDLSPDHSLLSFTIKEAHQSRIALLKMPDTLPCP